MEGKKIKDTVNSFQHLTDVQALLQQVQQNAFTLQLRQAQAPVETFPGDTSYINFHQTQPQGVRSRAIHLHHWRSRTSSCQLQSQQSQEAQLRLLQQLEKKIWPLRQPNSFSCQSHPKISKSNLYPLEATRPQQTMSHKDKERDQSMKMRKG